MIRGPWAPAGGARWPESSCHCCHDHEAHPDGWQSSSDPVQSTQRSGEVDRGIRRVTLSMVGVPGLPCGKAG